VMLPISLHPHCSLMYQLNALTIKDITVTLI
jgi:hypothetical protein